MEVVIIILVIGLMIAGGVRASKIRQAHNAELGVSSARDVTRLAGVNYLGGHPDFANPVNGCTMVFSPSEIAIERGTALLFRFPLSEVNDLHIETEEEAQKRVTVTRLALTGIFAFALKKKQPGSVLVSLETRMGPLAFEKLKVSKPEVMRSLARPTAIIRAKGSI